MSNVTYISVLKKRKFIFWLIAICCVLVVIYLISSFPLLNFILQDGLTNGWLFSAVILLSLLALLPFAFISSIYFLWTGRGIRRTLLWFTLCLIVFVFGIMIATFYIPMLPAMRDGFLFLAFPVSLIGTLLIFDSKDMFRKVYSIILLIPILLCAPTVLCSTLPYLYSPTVLTKRNIKTYNQAISFLLYESILDLQDPNLAGSDVSNKLDRAMPDKLVFRLDSIGCWKFREAKGIAMFFKHGNRIFPPGPGVAYSLYGNNPNDVNDEYVNKVKPFEPITGNWYLSRNMTLAGPRRDIRITTPRAFIDRSKVINNVPAEELHRFDNWQKQEDSNSVPNL